MAITGLVGVRAAKLDYSAGTYSDPIHVGDAMTANITITMAEGSLYANNVRKEHLQRFDAGEIELGVDDLLDSVLAYLLGHTTKSVGSETVNVSKTTDIIPEVGLGFYQTVIRSGVSKFRVIILKRVTFAEPQDNAETSNNSITMNGRTMTGTILADSGNEWKYDVTVDTATEADALITAVLGAVS